MFKIATVVEPRPYGSIAGPTDGVISYRNRGEHAERKHRQIIEEIECCEARADVLEMLNSYEREIIALDKDYPEFAQLVRERANDWFAMLPPT